MCIFLFALLVTLLELDFMLCNVMYFTSIGFLVHFIFTLFCSTANGSVKQGLMMAWFVLLDIMKSKSTPDFLKKERTPLTKQLRGVRSKVGVDEYKQLQNMNPVTLSPNNSRT